MSVSSSAEDGSVLPLSFRFASDVGFRHLPLLLPCTVGDVRQHLKSKLNITSPLDVVVYSIELETDTEDSILDDEETLFGGTRCIVKRVPESLAKVLMQRCRSKYVTSSSTLYSDGLGPSESANGKLKMESNSESDNPPVSRLHNETDGSVHSDSTTVYPNEDQSYTECFHGSGDTLATSAMLNTMAANQIHVESKHNSLQNLNESDGVESENGSLNYPGVLNQNLISTTDSMINSSAFLKEKNNSEDSLQSTDDSLLNLNELEEEDDDEEEKRERLLMRKVVEEHANHRGPSKPISTIPGKPSSDHFFSVSDIPTKHHGMGRPRDPFGRRYFKNRNLTWARGSENSTALNDSSCPPPPYFARNNVRRAGLFTSRHIKHVIPVCDNYLCHLCGEKGHHIRNCPKGTDPKQQKKVKPATGFPRSWLRRISKDQVALLDCDVYSLTDGTFAVLKDLTSLTNGAALAQPLDKKIQQRYGAGSGSAIGSHLQCRICERLFQKAMLMPCCGETFCEICALSRMNSERTKIMCPSCNDNVNPNDLSSNKVIQNSVDAVLGMTCVLSNGIQYSDVKTYGSIGNTSKKVVDTKTVITVVNETTNVVDIGDDKNSRRSDEVDATKDSHGFDTQWHMRDDRHAQDVVKNQGTVMGTADCMCTPHMILPQKATRASVLSKHPVSTIGCGIPCTKELSLSFEDPSRLSCRIKRPSSNREMMPYALRHRSETVQI